MVPFPSSSRAVVVLCAGGRGHGAVLHVVHVVHVSHGCCETRQEPSPSSSSRPPPLRSLHYSSHNALEAGTFSEHFKIKASELCVSRPNHDNSRLCFVGLIETMQHGTCNFYSML